MIIFKSLSRFAIAIFILTLFYNNIANATVPSAPSNARGYYQNGVVRLYWSADNNDVINHFKIYYCNRQSQDISDFRMLIEVSKDSTRRDTTFYSWNIYSLQAGVHSFYITAVNSDGESDPSDFIYVYINNYNTSIRFISDNQFFGSIGNELEIDVDAESSDSSEVNYRLISYENGMTIDEETGVISWTPNTTGYYRVVVEAYLVNNENIKLQQTIYIYILHCSQPSVLTGFVEYSNGNIVRGGIAMLKKLTINPADSGIFRYADINGGYFIFENLDSGSYKLYLSGGQAFRSKWYENSNTEENATIINIGCNENDTIYASVRMFAYINFSSSPNTKAVINQQYTYTAYAWMSDSSEVRYRLLSGPTGMIINELTGVITWTPTVKGKYQVSIQAYSLDDETISTTQSFTILVRSCQTPGVLVAYITDEKGNPATFGMISIYSEGGNPADSNNFIDRARFSDGYFIYPDIDEGNYFLWIDGYRNYENEWYQDAQDFEDATVVEIDCVDTTFIYIQLQSMVSPNYYTVSGWVKRADNGQPVNYARIDFYGKKENSNQIFTYSTMTYQQGYYSIQLSNEYQYIAYCYVSSDTINVPNTDLMGQYFNLVSDATLAEIITLTGNRNDINFLLQTQPEYENELSGIVTDENGINIPQANVVAYIVAAGPWNQDKLYTGKSTISDGNGLFNFDNLIPGTYVLYAYPMNYIYVPGYYVTNSIAVPDWQDATQIEVEESGDAGYHAIILPLRQIIQGNGNINGYVREVNGKIITNDELQGSEPIKGATVYVLNKNNKVIGWQLSNQNGKFEINKLGKGIYTLKADRIGYQKFNQNIELENESSKVQTDCGLIPISTTEVNELNNNNDFVKIYPNPSSDLINIYLKTDNERVSITLTNVNGVEIYKESAICKLGENAITISCKDIPQGIYYLKIINGILVNIYTICIVR